MEHRIPLSLSPSDKSTDKPHRIDKVYRYPHVGPFRLLNTLGIGTFGKVKLGEHYQTGHKVAVKIVNKEQMNSLKMSEKISREIYVLRKLLNHPHIIKLYDLVDSIYDIFVIMEFVSGGELFDYIVHNVRISENGSRLFFQQIVSGIEFCHSHDIIHRDLKPENLLLDSCLRIKIADFGLSNMSRSGEFLKTSCGSPNYASPEVVCGRAYAGPEIDIWSCGVVLFSLLCGSLPFDDENIPNLFRKIKHGNFTLPGHLSTGSKDLISNMLIVDSVKRIQMPGIRSHPWFLKDCPPYLSLPWGNFTKHSHGYSSVNGTSGSGSKLTSHGNSIENLNSLTRIGSSISLLKNKKNDSKEQPSTILSSQSFITNRFSNADYEIFNEIAESYNIPSCVISKIIETGPVYDDRSGEHQFITYRMDGQSPDGEQMVKSQVFDSYQPKHVEVLFSEEESSSPHMDIKIPVGGHNEICIAYELYRDNQLDEESFDGVKESVTSPMFSEKTMTEILSRHTSVDTSYMSGKLTSQNTRDISFGLQFNNVTSGGGFIAEKIQSALRQIGFKLGFYSANSCYVFLGVSDEMNVHIKFNLFRKIDAYSRTTYVLDMRILDVDLMSNMSDILNKIEKAIRDVLGNFMA